MSYLDGILKTIEPLLNNSNPNDAPQVIEELEQKEKSNNEV